MQTQTLNKTILLVEDNPTDEKLIRLAFKKNAILSQIIIAHDGVEALDYLFCTGMYEGKDSTVLPTIIILDLKLPRISGIEVLQQIRSDNRTKLTPTVILTSSKEEEDILQCYSSGANAYVRKPVDFTEFTSAIKTLGIFWLLLNEPPPSSKVTD